MNKFLHTLMMGSLTTAVSTFAAGNNPTLDEQSPVSKVKKVSSLTVVKLESLEKGPNKDALQAIVSKALSGEQLNAKTLSGHELLKMSLSQSRDQAEKLRQEKEALEIQIAGFQKVLGSHEELLIKKAELQFSVEYFQGETNRLVDTKVTLDVFLEIDPKRSLAEYFLDLTEAVTALQTATHEGAEKISPQQAQDIEETVGNLTTVLTRLLSSQTFQDQMKDLSTAKAQYEDLKRDIKALMPARQESQELLARAQKEQKKALKQLDVELTEATEKRDSAQKKLEATQARLEALKTEEKALKKKLEQEGKKRPEQQKDSFTEKLTERIAAQEESIEKLNAQIESLREDLTKTYSNNRSLQDSLTAHVEESEKFRKMSEARQQEIIQLEATLHQHQSVESEKATEDSLLTSQVTSLQGQIKDLQVTISTQKKQLTENQETTEKLEESLKAARSANATLKSAKEASMSQPQQKGQSPEGILKVQLLEKKVRDLETDKRTQESAMQEMRAKQQRLFDFGKANADLVASVRQLQEENSNLKMQKAFICGESQRFRQAEQQTQIQNAKLMDDIRAALSAQNTLKSQNEGLQAQHLTAQKELADQKQAFEVRLQELSHANKALEETLKNAPARENLAILLATTALKSENDLLGKKLHQAEASALEKNTQISDLESQLSIKAQKMEAQDSQAQEQIRGLRSRVQSMEEENAKLQELHQKEKVENGALVLQNLTHIDEKAHLQEELNALYREIESLRSQLQPVSSRNPLSSGAFLYPQPQHLSPYPPILQPPLAPQEAAGHWVPVSTEQPFAHIPQGAQPFYPTQFPNGYHHP